MKRMLSVGAIVAASLITVVGAQGATAANCTISSTLRRGSESSDVACLETRLIELGYQLVGPDNSFGTSTQKAAKAFQKAKGLTVDGIVGPKTAGALGIWAATPAAAPAAPPTLIESRTIGTSVDGRKIVADRYGKAGGRVVLVVGTIHGDENKGALITKLLRSTPMPANVDLWLIDSMNPDGSADNTRTNSNDVDLNRNFSADWELIPRSTEHRQFSGDGPADQPETQAMEAFINELKPALTIWYHQDLNVVAGSSATAKKYASLAGMTTKSVGCSTKCTGTAGAFVKSVGGITLLVELPSSGKVTDAMVQRHAQAVLGVAVG
jgi:murein peptide amidase A